MDTGARRIMVAVGVAASVLAGGTSMAADRAVPVIVLRVIDHAGTESADLTGATVEIHRIFDAIGVRVVWSDMKAGPERHVCEGLNLFVSVVSPGMIEARSSQGISDDVLGSASKAAGRAFIDSRRVRARAARSSVGAPVLLGRVIAHEIGHLVLPGIGHSRAGIMAAGIETDPRGARAQFLSREAQVIRAFLESKADSREERTGCGN